MYIDFEVDTDYSSNLEELTRVLHEAPANPKPPLGTNPYISFPVVTSSQMNGSLDTNQKRCRRCNAEVPSWRLSSVPQPIH